MKINGKKYVLTAKGKDYLEIWAIYLMTLALYSGFTSWFLFMIWLMVNAIVGATLL